ncbi:MAG: mannose-1-phosphate guanylyltransferase/mannose-6-phosphate isomerase [Actinomycetes bacterium]|jgi:mannose-1-phosphate guanylyltransferase/mannose-6-phosphate isomerase|nr:mannose-1-phosphate guanylyltransferase/mannose-6-phosphate isomerase [Actinomycetes bacterium]
MALHAVILAGGSGTRFWPLSRELAPKQLLTVFGDRSLMAATVERARQVTGDTGDIRVVVGGVLFDELRNHLLAAGDGDIAYLVEPAPRNTAPALALAAADVLRADADGIVIMLPSDHICQDGERWQRTIAAAVAGASDGSLVTIGLVPRSPDTAFGYIHAAHAASDGFAEEAAGRDSHAVSPARAMTAIPVTSFTEKPDAETAERYVAAGDYYWNSGMLVARADAILRELERAAERHPDVPAAAGNLATVACARAIAAGAADTDAAWDALPPVSFDHAALELSDRVKVVPADLDWSDVGSLTSLERLAAPDARGVRIIGQGVDVDSRDTLNYSSERLVATLGLDDVLVVDTADATLVAARDRAQDVRLVVDELRRRGAPELTQNKTSLRPWGSWTMLTRGIGYQVKEIEVAPAARLSLQSHTRRSEHWIVIAGTATVTRDTEHFDVAAGESTFLPIGCKHSLENRGDIPLRIVEVAIGDYLGEDDITRYDDPYGRSVDTDTPTPY